MKPTKKQKLVQIEYWDCGNPEHTHRTEEVAARCIEQRKASERHRQQQGSGLKWTEDTLLKVLTDYRAGARKVDLANSLGISQTRIAQVIAQAERAERGREIKKGSADPLAGLTRATRNCLVGASIYSPAAARDALANGELEKIPNVGKTRMLEIQQWLASAPPNA